MQKFKGVEKSWFSQFNVQAAFLFFLAVASIGASLYYFNMTSSGQSLSEGGSFSIRSSRLEKTEAGLETGGGLTQNSAENATGNVNDGLGGEGQVEIAVADQSQLDQLASRGSGADGRGAENLNSNAAFQNPRIKMSFVEISQEQLVQLLADVQNEGLLQRDNETFKGIINNVAQLSKYNYRTLKQDVKDIKPNQIEAFFFGRTVRESSQFMGLQINLEKKSSIDSLNSGGSTTAAGTSANADSGVNTAANGTTEARWTLTANKILGQDKQSELHEFQIQNNSALFINARAWLEGFQVDRELADTAPFQVLRSPDFSNQRTEVLILLEFY